MRNEGIHRERMNVEWMKKALENLALTREKFKAEKTTKSQNEMRKSFLSEIALFRIISSPIRLKTTKDRVIMTQNSLTQKS